MIVAGLKGLKELSSRIEVANGEYRKMLCFQKSVSTSRFRGSKAKLDAGNCFAARIRSGIYL
jgi:hypothetical protein